MEVQAVNRTLAGYELTDELALCCLPLASRDASLKLAWINSICILFLTIGIVGVEHGGILIRPVPPIQGIVPVVVEPLSLPPQTAERKEQADELKNDQPRVVVALPNAPNVSFGVPTIGMLAAPAALASAPPADPLRTRARIGSLDTTGAGGERPQPPYPRPAVEQGEQGTVLLRLTGDAAGNVLSVEVEESSGSPLLDRATVDFIKRRWQLPTGFGVRLFETSITYKLQLNF